MTRYLMQIIFSFSVLGIVAGCSTLSMQTLEKQKNHENIACTNSSVLIADLTKQDFLKYSSEKIV